MSQASDARAEAPSEPPAQPAPEVTCAGPSDEKGLERNVQETCKAVFLTVRTSGKQSARQVE